MGFFLEAEGVWEEKEQGLAGQPRPNLKVTLRKYYDHEVELGLVLVLSLSWFASNQVVEGQREHSKRQDWKSWKSVLVVPLV